MIENHWFKKGFKKIDKTPILDQVQDNSPRLRYCDDLDAECSSGQKEHISTMKPTCLNAFDIISLSPGFDLSSLRMTRSIDMRLDSQPKSRRQLSSRC